MTTTLTPNTIPDTGYQNTAVCTFYGFDREVQSATVRILPPFGTIKNTTSENFYLIALTISVSSLVLILILVISVKKILKRKAK